MEKILLVFFVLSQFLFLNAQTITEKLVDQNGNGLPGMQLKLYINPKTYDATSSTDGSFIFNSITNVQKGDELPTGYSVSENYPHLFNPKKETYPGLLLFS